MDATDPEPSELATLEIGLRGTLVVGRLEGEVDLSNAAALEARILAALRGASALVLDLADVTYLDSAALARCHAYSPHAGVRGPGWRACFATARGRVARSSSPGSSSPA